MKQDLFQDLLHAAHHVYSSTDALQQFAPWPSDLYYVDRPVKPVPAIRQIKKWSDTHPLHIATQQVADFGIGNKPTQKMKWDLGSCMTMVVSSFMDRMAIFRQIKAALTLGTGDGAYIILGTGMKQKKYMLL